jgi:hypothetical protein
MQLAGEQLQAPLGKLGVAQRPRRTHPRTNLVGFALGQQVAHVALFGDGSDARLHERLAIRAEAALVLQLLWSPVLEPCRRQDKNLPSPLGRHDGSHNRSLATIATRPPLAVSSRRRLLELYRGAVRWRSVPGPSHDQQAQRRG